jgi:phospholipid-binding lipoprotein MlaA
MNAKAQVMRLFGGVVFALALSALSGCATTASNPRDPIEGFNRAMFSFNDALDGAVFKPVAQGYRSAIPALVRTGVTNFFSNIDDIWVAINNALQGKADEALQDVMRVAVNTVFGLGGILDISTDMGLKKHNEDFGQTLGKWGVGSGAYVVLPIFGPSSVRDAGGLLVDWRADPVVREDNIPLRNSAVALRTVDYRANLLDASDVLEQAALDKYTFVRDAFLQRRRSLIYDGNPPPESGASLDTDEPEPKAAAVPQQPREAAPAASSLVVPAVVAPVAAAQASAADAVAPVIYTVFADGVALSTPKADPDPVPAAAVVRFADNVVLQSR